MRYSKSIAKAMLITVLPLMFSTMGAPASQAAVKKTITCYKAKLVKKVVAVSPKCPTGWSTKKPVVKVTPTPKPTSTTVKPTTVAFTATYKGKMSVLWSDSNVTATNVNLTAASAPLSLTQLTGQGVSSPANSCDAIMGSGVLGSGSDTIKLSFDNTTKGCADSDAAPATISLTGTANITGGTGKYATATGSFKVTGTFYIKSSSAGFAESPSITINLNGSITTK